MESDRSEHDNRTSPPLQSQLSNSSLFREKDTDREKDENGMSTSPGQLPVTLPVTYTRPGAMSRKTIGVDAKATQLRELITKTQLQISDVQRRLEENCLRLEDLNVTTQQDTKSNTSLELTSSPASATTLSGSGDVDTSSHEKTIEQARRIVKNNIKQLTKYNELKDVSMALLGMIAEAEGKRLQEVMDERDIKCDVS